MHSTDIWDTRKANHADRLNGVTWHPTPRFAQQRHDIARQLAVLDRLEQLAQ